LIQWLSLDFFYVSNFQALMNMTIVFISIFVLSFTLTWLVRIVAIRKSIMDIPNDRSSHTVPTPRGGGLAVAVAWFTGLICFYAMDAIEAKLFFALLSGL
jgi:UDP-N-acetylmuramyl pentapeptide phosphotransferase/UDP-N-acetylglucosamine-1-phosphate transferase